MSALDARDPAGAFNKPVLVLSGKQDLSSSPEMMGEIPKYYAHAEFVSIDPRTHMAVMEQPDAVAAALVRFRDEVDRAFRVSAAG